MNEEDYLKIADHLAAALRVLQARRGELLEPDFRIRRFLDFGLAETRRQISPSAMPAAEPEPVASTRE